MTEFDDPWADTKDQCDSCGCEVAAAYLACCGCGALVCSDCFTGDDVVTYCKLCDPALSGPHVCDPSNPPGSEE